MKILQISYSLSSGGAERLVVDLSNELSKTNEVHLLTISDDNVGENGFYKSHLSKNVNYLCAKEIRGYSLKKIIRINQIVKNIAPDIVHFQGVNICLFFLPIIFFYKKPKYIETLHNKAEIIFRRKRSYIMKLIYKFNLVHLVTISHENKRSLKRVCKIYNTSLIYNGRSFPIKSTLSEQVKNEIDFLKKKQEDIVFIHIGRFSHQKNQEMLIDVFNRLKEDNISYILLIFGDGFNTKEGKELQLKANNCIHFFEPKLNIQDYLYYSDAFCLSSLYEGMPISLIEALACECIPICTPTSGVIDVLKNKSTGYISIDFTDKSYYNTIKYFIKDKSNIKLSKLSNLYLNKFSIKKCTDFS